MLTLGGFFEALTGRGGDVRRPAAFAPGDHRRGDRIRARRFPAACSSRCPEKKSTGMPLSRMPSNAGRLWRWWKRRCPALPPLICGRGKPAGHPALADPKQPLQLCLRVEDSLKALQTIAAAWREQLERLRVIGITGRVGKSTTKELVANVLAARYPTLANESNLNNEIGLPLTMLKITEAHRCAVLEMGLYVPGDIAFLCGIAGPAGRRGDDGRTGAPRAGRQPRSHRAAARPNWWRRCPRTARRSSTTTTTACAGWRTLTQRAGVHLRPRPEGRPVGRAISRAWAWRACVSTCTTSRETLHVHVPLLGQHSVHTALRAAAVGLVEGLNWQEIRRRAAGSVDPAPAGRGDGPRPTRLMIDDTYNASPDSMIAALNLLAEFDGRQIAVLGDMLELGDFEERGPPHGRGARGRGGRRTGDGRRREPAGSPRKRSCRDCPPRRIALYATAEEARPTCRIRCAKATSCWSRARMALRLDQIVIGAGDGRMTHGMSMALSLGGDHLRPDRDLGRTAAAHPAPFAGRASRSAWTDRSSHQMKTRHAHDGRFDDRHPGGGASRCC